MVDELHELKRLLEGVFHLGGIAEKLPTHRIWNRDLMRLFMSSRALLTRVFGGHCLANTNSLSTFIYFNMHSAVFAQVFCGLLHL